MKRETDKDLNALWNIFKVNQLTSIEKNVPTKNDNIQTRSTVDHKQSTKTHKAYAKKKNQSKEIQRPKKLSRNN